MRPGRELDAMIAKQVLGYPVSQQKNIEGDSWSAPVGNGDRFKSPADFLKYVQSADFVKAGASVDESAPLTICLAADRIE